MEKIKEADLYQPIKDFFISSGYSVKGEVYDVDIVISKEDELIAIEMKTAFNLKLLTQAVQRQKIFDSVYVAIIMPKKTYKNKRYKEIVHLLKRLEIGLITVNFLKTKTDVRVEHHPIEFNKKRNNKKRALVIKEINSRTGIVDNIAGTTKVKRVTAYREKAIHIACLLYKYGESSPKFLRSKGADSKTTSILYGNHYGWFDRINNGVYNINEKGSNALIEYKEISNHFNLVIKDLDDEEN